jgi:protein-disulfide isomerase
MFSIKSSILTACLGLQFLIAMPARATVETATIQSLKSSGTPVDSATSADGHWYFVLTSQGQVEIYGADGTLKDKIKTPGPADSIASSPTGGLLYLSNKATGAITLLAVNFVQDINTVGAPFKGPANAPVAVVVFSDFQCPYCARVSPFLDQVLKMYPKEVKVVYKNFPLRIHQFSMQASIAALAAHRQGKFWEMHDKILENYKALSNEKFSEFAKEIGLNMDKFNKDINDPALRQQVETDLQDGIKAEVRGTPTLFVNGRLLNEGSLEGIKTLIDAELKKVKK